MNPSRRPFVIGITGNIAAGKSTVLQVLADLGATTIDMDVVTRSALRSDGDGFSPVVQRFGREILDDQGEIDRARLGQIVFSEPANLRELEAIIHPLVGEIAKSWVEQAGTPVVAIEAIKMLEGGKSRDLCDLIWVVTSDERMQLARLRETRGMTEDDGLQRLANQSSQEWKVEQADHVVSNIGTKLDLEERVGFLWRNVVQPILDGANGGPLVLKQPG